MNKLIHKNLLKMLKSKGILAISGGMLMVSCTIQTGGYSETDGVYYDPNTDTLPQGVAMDEGNRVGDYYDYQNNGNIVEKSQQNEEAKRNRYRSKTWSDNTQNGSDWGVYAGTETNVYNNYWGSAYGFYPRYGWGSYYGLSFGWGSPWAGSFYDPFWGYGYGSSFGFYSPYYYGGYYGYSPYYYGYNPYGYYSPYNYYGGYYGRPYYSAPRRSRGADGLVNTGTTNRSSAYQNPNAGFRTQGTYQGRTAYPGSTSTAQPRVRATQPRTEMRTNTQQPVYRENTYRSESTMRSSDSGFRSGGGFNSGGMSSGSTSRSGGGFRTGGGR